MATRATVNAAKDPVFLAGAVKPGVRRIAQGIHRVTRTLAPCVWQGQGYSLTGGVEHASGRALDIIVPASVGQTPTPSERAQGDALAAWLILHASKLGVAWVIWRQRIYNVQSRPYWRQMEDRGGVTNNHHDHLHVYFREGADWPAGLDATTPTTNTGVLDMTPDQVRAQVKQALDEWLSEATLQPSEKGKSIRGSSIRNVLIYISVHAERVAKKLGVIQ